MHGSHNINISLLVPTREHPKQLKQLYESILETADKPFQVELIVYIDKDDRSYDTLRLPRMVKIKGEPLPLEEMIARCKKYARGKHSKYFKDTYVFLNKGWDTELQ